MTTVAGEGAGVGTKRWSRLIPVAIIVYIISFMDRTNIGFALAAWATTSASTRPNRAWQPGSSSSAISFLQIPGGYLAEHWSAKKFVGIMILVWGVLAVAVRIRAELHPTADRALPARRRRGRHLARDPRADQPLVPRRRTRPRLRRLDDEHRDLLDHHRAAVGVDPLLRRTGGGCSSSRARSRSSSRHRCGGWLVADHPREAKWCSGRGAGVHRERDWPPTARRAPSRSAGWRDVVRNTVVLRLDARLLPHPDRLLRPQHLAAPRGRPPPPGVPTWTSAW